MRVFVALDIDENIRSRIAQFADDLRPYAPGVRWVKSESLHITLKFIGEKPEPLVKQIEQALGSISIAPFQITFAGSGFFPTPKAARVFWIGIAGQAGLAELATKIEDALIDIDIPKEERAFSPHLTLARSSRGSGAPGWRKGDKPNRQFAVLERHLEGSAAREFGTMTAREFFLYRSQLSSKGSTYTKIARFGLS
jgi:2'-5' RNA ligase